jgi:hypothetical protein
MDNLGTNAQPFALMLQIKKLSLIHRIGELYSYRNFQVVPCILSANMASIRSCCATVNMSFHPPTPPGTTPKWWHGLLVQSWTCSNVNTVIHWVCRTMLIQLFHGCVGNYHMHCLQTTTILLARSQQYVNIGLAIGHSTMTCAR